MPHSKPTVEPFRPPIQPRSKREKLHDIGEKAKFKTQELLHIDHVEKVDTRSPNQKTIAEVHDDGAFSPLQFLNKPNVGAPAGKSDKFVKKLQVVGDAILHPVEAVKTQGMQTTAGQLAKSKPFISRTADLDFLDAFDDLDGAKDQKCDTQGDEEAKKIRLKELGDAFDIMEEKRLSIRVAWQTNRHVQRVKAVRRERMPLSPIEAFEKADDCGEKQLQVGRYIAMALLHASYPYTTQYIDDFDELPFDLGILRRHIERFIIVSAPMQDWIIQVRKVYTWEDPWYTIQWMGIYFFFWYIRHIMTAVWGYFILLTLRNYYFPRDLDDLRESIKRTLDRGTTAFKVAELMDQHGNQDWLKPFIEEIGPYLQVQIQDLANFLEVLYNFYHWKDPAKTRASLTFMIMIFVVCILGSTTFGLSVFYLTCGFVFFVCWPIASNYPKYRLLVSPLKWAFWDVPTHAEWSFQYLQQRSVGVLKALEKETGDWTGTEGLEDVKAGANGLHVTAKNDLGDESISGFTVATDNGLHRAADILQVRCMHANIPGHLIISATGIRFHSSLPHSANVEPSSNFFVAYKQIDEIRKRTASSWGLKTVSKYTVGLEKLELKVWNLEDLDDPKESESGHTIMLEAMPERDKAFNAIIGFSGRRWQNLASGWDDQIKAI